MTEDTYASRPWSVETNGKTYWVQTPAPFRQVIVEGILRADHARLFASAPVMLMLLQRVAETTFSDLDGVSGIAQAAVEIKREAREIVAQVLGVTS